MLSKSIDMSLLDEEDLIEHAHEIYKSKSGNIKYNKGQIEHNLPTNKHLKPIFNAYSWLNFLTPRRLMNIEGKLFWRETEDQNALELSYVLTKHESPQKVIYWLQKELEIIAKIKRKPIITKTTNNKITPMIMSYNGWQPIGNGYYLKKV